ncbi:MAG TPA: tetraacyldisaccharide 4'-kinase [Gammaproteobacteria bacterium]|nr:tetraacyldisaccharide 4'-kinase [Gammaproteobacteria bacterium]
MSAWLLRRWYSPHPVWFLIPLAWLFWFLSSLRRSAYLLGIAPVVTLPVPVIVVGNITVGGTGKTPFVIWLAQELRKRGHRPGIITRGYGGSADSPRRAESDTDPGQVGDEALLLARHSGAPVAVGGDRVAAAGLLPQDVDVILSDDGLQHYRLARQHEIVLLDGSRGLGNGWLLPVGPLRETETRLAGPQVIIKVTPGGNFIWPGAARMRLKAETAVNLKDGKRRPLSSFSAQRVHAIAAIGNPQQFFATLEAAGLHVDGRALHDHAVPGAADLEFGDDLPVFMTEKDAVKCVGSALGRHWYLEAAAEFDTADAARILDGVERALAHGIKR